MSDVLVNGGPVDYTGLPDYMRGGMQRYIEQHIKPGDFLCCGLANNLCGAVEHADDDNLKLLGIYVRWLYNNAPSGCYGSAEKFGSWLAQRKVAT